MLERKNDGALLVVVGDFNDTGRIVKAAALQILVGYSHQFSWLQMRKPLWEPIHFKIYKYQKGFIGTRMSQSNVPPGCSDIKTEDTTGTKYDKLITNDWSIISWWIRGQRRNGDIDKEKQRLVAHLLTNR